MQTVYRPKELERRLRENIQKLWYVPMICHYYRTPDFDSIRKLNFIDVMTSLEHIINSWTKKGI